MQEISLIYRNSNSKDFRQPEEMHMKEQIHPVRTEEKPVAPMVVSDTQEAGDETEMDDRTRSLIASALSAFRSRG